MVMYALWGSNKPCSSKEIIFALLVLGHCTTPSMVVPYQWAFWMHTTNNSPSHMGNHTRAETYRPHAEGHAGG